MKLNPDFITYNKDGDHLLVPTGNAGFSGLVKGNKTMGDIVDLLKEETTKEKIVAAMLEKYDATEEIISRDVDKVLVELRKIGAILE